MFKFTFKFTLTFTSAFLLGVITWVTFMLHTQTLTFDYVLVAPKSRSEVGLGAGAFVNFIYLKSC